MPNPLLLTVDLNREISIRIVEDLMNPQAKASLNNVELMSLDEFSKFDGRTLTIRPISYRQAGRYPFVVRAFDD